MSTYVLPKRILLSYQTRTRRLKHEQLGAETPILQAKYANLKHFIGNIHAFAYYMFTGVSARCANGASDIEIIEIRFEYTPHVHVSAS